MTITGSFFKWYNLAVILASITFAYVAVLMVSSNLSGISGKHSCCISPRLLETLLLFNDINVDFQVLGVLHLACGQELYIHYIHKSLLAVIFIGSFAGVFIIRSMWFDGWILFSISLQVSVEQTGVFPLSARRNSDFLLSHIVLFEKPKM